MRLIFDVQLPNEHYVSEHAGPEMRIGRSPKCELSFSEERGVGVSWEHAIVRWQTDGVYLCDLNSTNGTFVNGANITGSVRLQLGDRVRLGDAGPELLVRQIDGDRVPVVPPNPAPQPAPKPARQPAPKPAPQLEATEHFAPSQQAPSVGARPVATSAVNPGASIVPLAKSIVLGRDPACNLVLDDPRVSRRHAQLRRSGSQMLVEDLGSSNGTFVDGRRIEQPTSVIEGQIIGVGRYTFRLTDDGQLEQRNFRGDLTIEICDLAIEVRARKLLDQISLTIYPSEFVALMGPSGAGKTTLMNAMNGYTPPTGGTVLFNGQDLYKNYDQFRGILGYVPQDDIMHGDLTVGQALYYTARLRLPADTSEAEIAGGIKKVISQLGLEGTENVLIGSPQKKGISGGQRKRVNLAMELLTDPSALFLDEPTSGLSSEDALTVMKLIRQLADAGKTVLLTIHQPSLEAYRLLDNLVLVSKDTGTKDPGRLAYYGPAYPQAVRFFNPDSADKALSPDDVLRGLSKKKTAEWVECYARSPLHETYVRERAGQQPSGQVVPGNKEPQRDFGIRQWWTLTRRTMAVKIKDTANSAILMAQAPIIALLVVSVFGKQASAEVTFENWTAVAGAMATTVFLLALAALWFGCSNAAREIVGEWPIYHRERMVNLKIPSYVASKLTVLGGLCVLQCAVLLGVVYWGAKLQGPLLTTFAILLLTSLVGLAIGLTISALARTSEVAIALLPLILLPMVILAGVLQPLHEMSSVIECAAQVTPSRWAFENLLLLESDARPKSPSPPAPTPGAAPAVPVSAQLPAKQDMAERFFPKEETRTGPWLSTIALASMLLVLVVAVHGILKFRDIH